MSVTDLSTIERFVRSIPKTETHLHLEGALPYQLLHELDPERFPINPEFRQNGYKYPNFTYFEDLLIEHAVAWYNSAERYHQAAKAIFTDLLNRNVRYLETSVHLANAEFMGFDPREFGPAIKDAVPEGMEVRLIAAFTRDGNSEFMKPVIDSLHTWEEIDGIDMHGKEWLDLEDWALPLWKRCKDAGKIVKAHAGEFGGPEKIYEALDQLGVDRIQHGVRAIEDADLVDRLASERIVLDVCPLSNEKLQVFPSLEEHSLKSLIDAGVICTINTDDPLCFANTIEDEYMALASRLDFSLSDLAEIAKNGFRHARMSDESKSEFIQKIDTELKLV
ncbi:MAG: adenosine deaminase family protein [Verrucomicrobiota bacterium]